jgi:cytochrome o ubiquinol oxidase subunit 3
MTDCILFATIFAAFAVLRKPTHLFDSQYALVETIVLLFSAFFASIAMLYSRWKMAVLWIISFLLGALFLVFQWSEIQDLMVSQVSWQTSGMFSSFFTLLAVHSLHIAAGLFMTLIFLIQLFAWGLTPVVHRRLSCLRIYWQFLYLIWFFTFTMIYLLGANP